MFRRLSKWFHDRRGYCGYEPVDDHRFYQGLFYCHHCKKLRGTKPVLKTSVLKSYID